MGQITPAMEQAAAADTARAKGHDAPLLGIPIALKDNISTQGIETTAGSKILEVHGERMIKRTFDPGFRIALHQKDLNLALSTARGLGMSLPNTATAQELFNACQAHGGAKWDHSAMVKALEILANHAVAK